MSGFKVTRIRIDGVTYDLDVPIRDPVVYQTIRRMNKEQAVERLVKNGNIKADKEIKRAQMREDAVIKALKKIGGIFIE